MKKILLPALIMCISITSLAQNKITADEVKQKTKIKWDEKYDEYVAIDGHTYRVGDTLKIGRPSSNKTFAFIQEGSGILTAATQADMRISGDNTIIKKIYVSGNKKQGFEIDFQTKGACDLCPKYYINAEEAFATGELISFGYTSDKALAELKKAKEKLDLGLITQEQFDKLKAELAPYIK